MASIINATTTAGVSVQGDNSGSLQLATNNGTTAVTIDTSQNVGIGTASPSQKLDISGTSRYIFNLSNAYTLQTSTNAAASAFADDYKNALSHIWQTSGTERMRIDSSGNLLFNSGYGSVATAYGCRAWVNFDGSANTNLTGTYTRTSPSTTLTVTATAHGLIVGSSVNLDFTTGTGLDGIYTVVTVADANTFTVTTVASTTTSGNVTLLRNTIRGSGNVSSITDNGTGDYTVNFTTAMPDVNYSAVMSCGGDNTANTGLRVANALTNAARTTSSIRVGTSSISNGTNRTSQNDTEVSVAIFR